MRPNKSANMHADWYLMRFVSSSSYPLEVLENKDTKLDIKSGHLARYGGHGGWCSSLHQWGVKLLAVSPGPEPVIDRNDSRYHPGSTEICGDVWNENEDALANTNDIISCGGGGLAASVCGALSTLPESSLGARCCSSDVMRPCSRSGSIWGKSWTPAQLQYCYHDKSVLSNRCLTYWLNWVVHLSSAYFWE